MFRCPLSLLFSPIASNTHRFAQEGHELGFLTNASRHHYSTSQNQRRFGFSDHDKPSLTAIFSGTLHLYFFSKSSWDLIAVSCGKAGAVMLEFDDMYLLRCKRECIVVLS